MDFTKISLVNLISLNYVDVIKRSVNLRIANIYSGVRKLVTFNFISTET